MLASLAAGGSIFEAEDRLFLAEQAVLGREESPDRWYLNTVLECFT
jgi:hypothetical protein